MEPDQCQECGCPLFTIRTIWHTEPTGTVDIYIKCASCGNERHEVYELLDPTATSGPQPKEHAADAQQSKGDPPTNNQ